MLITNGDSVEPEEGARGSPQRSSAEPLVPSGWGGVFEASASPPVEMKKQEGSSCGA